MSNKLISTVISVFLLGGQVAHANVEVNFVESAPKDRFVINNTSECVLKNLVLNLDLTNSTGGLIFDTTASGEGVEVFQPFEVVEGNLTLISSADVKDGDTKLSLNIESIQAKGSVSFSIDVDDTLADSELGNIRVSDAEITNASVAINFKGEKPITATFGSDGKALLLLPSCDAS
ncbi:MAG: hypothetical protein V7782_07465 [Psychromonas sp.]